MIVIRPNYTTHNHIPIITQSNTHSKLAAYQSNIITHKTIRGAGIKNGLTFMVGLARIRILRSREERLTISFLSRNICIKSTMVSAQSADSDAI